MLESGANLHNSNKKRTKQMIRNYLISALILLKETGVIPRYEAI